MVVGYVHTMNMSLNIFYHVVIDALQFIGSNMSFIQVIYMCKFDQVLRGATKLMEGTEALMCEVRLKECRCSSVKLLSHSSASGLQTPKEEFAG